jgi:hypothetical protein
MFPEGILIGYKKKRPIKEIQFNGLNEGEIDFAIYGLFFE